MTSQPFISNDRYLFLKVTKTPAHCYFCKDKTLFTLVDSVDGSEIWCCHQCALKHAKIKRLSSWMKKYSSGQKRLKTASILRVKKRQTDHLREGGEGL